MHPHNPPDRTEFEMAEFGAAREPADRRRATERSRSSAWAMFMAALVLAAVIAIVLLL